VILKWIINKYTLGVRTALNYLRLKSKTNRNKNKKENNFF
jgi:hypothetical protein